MIAAPEPDQVAPLIQLVAAGDRAAFRTLYGVAAPKLMGVLLRMLGTRSEAEDALQEVFTRVWTRAGRYDPALGRGMSWLIALTRNHAIDRLRARPAAAATRRDDDGREDDGTDALPDPGLGAEGGLIARGEARRVIDCMGRLEPDRAAAVRGAYLQGLSYQDLADRFGVPLNTMRTWLRRSLISLRECLGS
ncbi:MAG TPA: sigma-70 family RNA polymerase sigma factor [Paracoccaceae bacterium]|nr:sigma-70 family RNA polymerase sigma factor [Paracoccaceae bacterium]